MRKISAFLTGRLFVVSVIIVLQVTIISLFIIYLTNIFLPLFILFAILNLVIVTIILNKNSNPAFKLAWIIPILLFPVLGTLFYLLFGRSHLNRKNMKNLRKALGRGKKYIQKDYQALENIFEKDAHYGRMAEYITNAADTSVYQYTETEYLSPGDNFFKVLICELEKAERFIFMEYFIVAEGVMWETILEILIRKIDLGVEVWFMFDDIGSITRVGIDFPLSLKKLGFNVVVFNPFTPSLDQFLNYRDHRKYTIIDSKVAFTGGINIADEYVGLVSTCGFWEDSVIMLRGDAVSRMTISFLQIWAFASGETPDFEPYLLDFKGNPDGYVIPFSDEPLDNEFVAQNAYINLIEKAKNYIYICTPYLIIDDVIASSLIRAAKSKIDVKIMMPHIPDKKIIFYISQSNYSNLIKAGVEIYEFLPGFLHTKAVVSDDATAIVGTANFDFRSFYLHFENGVWLYNSKAVISVKNTFLSNLEQCVRITDEFTDNIPFWKRLICSILKVFSPLM